MFSNIFTFATLATLVLGLPAEPSFGAPGAIATPPIQGQSEIPWSTHSGGESNGQGFGADQGQSQGQVGGFGGKGEGEGSGLGFGKGPGKGEGESSGNGEDFGKGFGQGIGEDQSQGQGFGQGEGEGKGQGQGGVGGFGGVLSNFKREEIGGGEQYGKEPIEKPTPSFPFAAGVTPPAEVPGGFESGAKEGIPTGWGKGPNRSFSRIPFPTSIFI